MSGTTSDTPVCTISATGIYRPPFEDVLAWATAKFQGIWGADVYLGNDSPDGQWVALWAKSIDDANAMAVAVYLSFSPATATGAALSSNVKINGLKRAVPDYSTCDVIVVADVGLTITNGVVNDGTYKWALPASITIPDAGQLTVTATCTTLGAITAQPGTITGISTPTRGWQSVTNTVAATAGQPVELDPDLRQRQAVSTEIPSQTLLDGIVGAIETTTGVVRVQPYENDTDVTDANGLPPHSLALVVDGGAIQDIVNVIGLKKGTGAGTYGTTTGIYTSPQGRKIAINFLRPALVKINVTVNISIAGLQGYTTLIGSEIQTAVLAYLAARPIGGDGGKIMRARIFVPAQLAGPYATPASPTDASTYELLDVLISRDAGTPVDSDIVLAFNEAPNTATSVVTVNVAS